VYAFSIENFKRTKYEVDALMDMAKTRLVQFAEHGELLERYGARLKFLGRRDILRADVLAAIDNAIDLTKNNGRYDSRPQFKLRILTNSSAILNICAPYTSRDEMAKSMRDTVIQYCQPLRPHLKRPFSETHITRNIRAQRLSASGEKPEIQRSSVAKSPEETFDDEYVYKPNLPESQAAFGKILKLVSRLLGDAADEHTLSADDAVIAGATNSILYHLKDDTITVRDKQVEVSDVVGAEVSTSHIEKLLQLADRLVDYAADEETQASESTTLNTSCSTDPPTHQAHSQQPAVKYPDVERITAETLTANTYTGANAPPLDILIRTSGVERLSDFMLWQCHESTEVEFVSCYWPDFGLKHLLPILLEWQWRRRKDSVHRSYWNDGRPSSADSADWRKLE
jgi:ditrans,polycis-polyprenyl diphosphate synthase